MLGRLPLAITVIATAVALAGCGGDADEDETTAVSEGTATEQGEAAIDEEQTKRVQQLIPVASQSQIGKSMKQSLKIADAQGELLAIAAENPAAIEPLLQALEQPDYDRIIEIYPFYIQLGKPGTEKAIGEALQRLEPSPENNPIVFAYLGSGNTKLVQAAEKWAADNGYTITGKPTPVAGGWGSAGVYGPPGVPPGAVPAPAP